MAPDTVGDAQPVHAERKQAKQSAYVGRFAPSPTGPLHFGSLITALASYLDARANRGRWLVRIEDIDPPREEAGAAESILISLRDHGLHWDGDPLYQSTRFEVYQRTADELIGRHQAYFCTCSRSQLAGHSVYPGHCRSHFTQPSTPYAVRLLVPAEAIEFDDAIQGHCCEWLQRSVGDFIIFRKERLPAYQLAVVIDDAAEGVTHIVRGCDLLDNTARQIHLQRCLNLPTPRYAHIPVIANPLLQKLSKQTFARAIDPARAHQNVRAALEFLGQPVPASAACNSVAELLRYAVEHWSLSKIPHTRVLSGDQLPESCRGYAT